MRLWFTCDVCRRRFWFWQRRAFRAHHYTHATGIMAGPSGIIYTTAPATTTYSADFTGWDDVGWTTGGMSLEIGSGQGLPLDTTREGE